MTKELDFERYAKFLDPKMEFEGGGSHWEKANKTVFTLLFALMDQDLTELVRVLERFPNYTQLACEHFRYSYSYNEIEADIFAASKLLTMCEPYATNQFVRNVLAKLKKIEHYEASEVKEFVDILHANKDSLNQIVLSHYEKKIAEWIDKNQIHLLQKAAINKKLSFIPKANQDFTSSDRDKNLDIPYMA